MRGFGCAHLFFYVRLSMKSIKERIYNIIRDDNKKGALGNAFDAVIIFFIIVNVIMVIAETFTLPAIVKDIFYYIEIISIIIFTIEYILRVYTSDLLYNGITPLKARFKYIFSAMAIIDLLAIIPFYLPFVIPIDLRVLRMLRMFRLLRVLKVNRYTDALTSIIKVFKRKKNQLLSSIFVVVVLMVVASIIMYNIESAAQPNVFKNAFSALWWAVATFTTVGYGDIYPITAAGKLLSAIIAFLGIALIAVPTGIITAGFTEQINEDKEQHQDKKDYCPYCGHKLE